MPPTTLQGEVVSIPDTHDAQCTDACSIGDGRAKVHLLEPGVNVDRVDAHRVCAVFLCVETSCLDIGELESDGWWIETRLTTQQSFTHVAVHNRTVSCLC